MSLAWAAYRVAAPCLGALAPLARMFAPARERRLWNERLGRVSSAGSCEAWIHAASLGESTGVGPLVAELRALAPGARVRLTALTHGGRARLEHLGEPVGLAPIDAPQAVARFFRSVRPRFVILVETELWPHWLLRARREQVPVAVVSARLSARSIRRYRHLGGEFRALVAGIEAVVCQSPEGVGRWIELGARPERIAVAGNLKNDALPRPPESRGAARDALGLDRERPLLVLGSLRTGEATVLARAWNLVPAAVRSGWQVVAIPRHPHAARDLEDEARRSGVAVVRSGAPEDGAWRWDDRLGVLAGYYAAADVAFVGGSLGRRGGHNPLEPAACGAAVLIGAHHPVQRDAVAALAAHDAVAVVRDTAECSAALERLLGDPAERARCAAAGREVAESLRGAARRTVAELTRRGLWPVE